MSYQVAQREHVLNLYDILHYLESSPMDRDTTKRVKLIHYNNGILVLRMINGDTLEDGVIVTKLSG